VAIDILYIDNNNKYDTVDIYIIISAGRRNVFAIKNQNRREDGGRRPVFLCVRVRGRDDFALFRDRSAGRTAFRQHVNGEVQ